MKITKIRLASLFIAFTLLLSFSGEHPTGRTGAPGEQTCANGCHSGGASFSGAISISGVPGNATANETYTLTIDVTASGAAEAGFSMVALDSNNDNTGDFTNPGGGSSLRTNGGREYWGHNPSQDLSGGSVTWDVDWTAPNVNDDVTFYVAAVCANGAGGNSGDEVVVEEQTISVTLPVVDLDLLFDSASVTCAGGEDGSACVEVSNGTGPYEYEWSNGGDGECIENLSGGVYSVTVTDAIGGTGSGMVMIDEPEMIDNNADINDITCNGFDDGRIDVNPNGGTGTLECVWDFDNGCNQQDLSPGFYSVTVVDENMCEEVFEFEIQEPDELEIDISTNPADMGNNGTAECIGSGGTPFYDFEWSTGFSDSNAESSEIGNLSPGTYSVTVTDQNDCEIIQDFTIAGAVCDLALSANAQDVSCFKAADGSITLSVNTTSANPSFLWSDGSTTQSISNLNGGTYSVTVMDGPMCSDSIMGIVVSEPDSLRAELRVQVNPSCPDISNGRLVVEILGGNGGYDMVWSNGLTNDTTITGMDTLINLPDTLMSLELGTYAYTLTDSKGCTSLGFVEMINADALAPFVEVMDLTIELDQSGNADAIGFDDIDDGSFDNCGIEFIDFSAGPFDCDDTGTREYRVTIGDANQNTTTESVNITVLEMVAPEIDCSMSSVVSSNCQSVSYVQPLATDNCGVESLELIDGLQSGSQFPVGETTITYRAMDASGNSAECSFTVTVENTLSVQIAVTDAKCGQDNGSIEVVAMGGTPPYEISPGATDDLPTGTYTITIEDSAGCIVEETVTVGEADNNLVIDAINVNDVLCAGESTGSVDFEVSGGTGSVTVEIDGDPDNLSAGDYTVTVTDSLGCQISDMFTVREIEALVADLTIDCDTFELAVGGGAMPYQIDTLFAPPNISFQVTDANGCTTGAGGEFLSSPEIVLVEIVDQAADVSESGSIDVTVGNLSTSQVVWTDEFGNEISNEEDVSGLNAGMYTITVTSMAGCTSSMTFEVLLETSVEDIDNFFARLYPNPASDNVILEFSSEVPSLVELIDVTGKVVNRYQNKEQNRMILDVQNVESGLYIVRMEFDERQVVKRFLKN